jgi:hypothetical protein
MDSDTVLVLVGESLPVAEPVEDIEAVSVDDIEADKPSDTEAVAVRLIVGVLLPV